MEDYAAKMQLKTEAGLREYVTGYAQYREAAVLAALDELRRRGRPAPEVVALRPELEAGAARQRELDEAAEKARQAEEVAEVGVAPESVDPADPALFSTGTIIIFSILFPILGGAALLAANLIQLRRWRGLAALGLFVLSYLVSCGLLLYGLISLGVSALLLLLVPLLLALPAIAVYAGWFWPRYFWGAALPQPGLARAAAHRPAAAKAACGPAASTSSTTSPRKCARSWKR